MERTNLITGATGAPRELRESVRKRMEYMGESVKLWLAIAAGWMVLMVLTLPCLLTFSQGEGGKLTVWNFVGLAWCAGLALVARRVLGGKERR